MSDHTQTLVTDNHHLFLNAGGLLLIESEEIEDELEEHNEEATSHFVARHDGCSFLSPDEALRIADLVEQNRTYLEARAQELNRYFTQVATAWLQEFRLQALVLNEHEVYWWPQVRHEALNALVMLTNAQTNPVLTAWYEQARKNENFPRSQQETLLLRYFKKLYYEKYPIPDVTTDQDEEHEQAN